MSLSKNTEKYIRSLSQKKFRHQYNKFIAEGDKLVKEILRYNNAKLEILLAIEEWYFKNEELIRESGVEVTIVSTKVLQKVSQLKTANQVLLVAEQLHPKLEESIVKNDWSLYLDRIQDPGNMGTILRIANWFNIQHVFCSLGCAEIYNPKVIQSSMGAFLRVQCIDLELVDFRKQFPDVPIYATAMNGKSIYEMDKKKGGLIIMGNEGQGVDEEILRTVEQKISIPSYGKSEMESLNVAMATGIICAELRR